MAVPKKKLSKSRRDKRRANHDRMDPPAVSNCRQCGAPVEQKDIKVVQGGLMVTCPYCSAVYALEEAPKW